MNLRILTAALLATAAALVCAVTATASVTGLTSPEGEPYEGSVAAEAEGHVVFDNPLGTIKCNSAIGVDIEAPKGEEVRAGGPVTSLSFSGCTESWHVTVVSAGTLSVEHTSGSNGEVFSTGATIEATRFGINCRYATSNTKVGTLTGGSPATLDLAAAIPFHSGSAFCGSGATSWTGSYAVTAPTVLAVDDLLHYKATNPGKITFYGAIGPTQSSEWVIGGEKATCTEASFESPLTETRAKTLLLEPHYRKCTYFGFTDTTSAANGCQFELKQPSTLLKSNSRINCPSGQSISLVGQNGAGNVCEVLIGEPGNVNLAENKYTNIETKKFEVSFELKEITAQVTKATGTCPLKGKEGVIKGVTYKAQVTIEDHAQKEGVYIG